MNQYINILLVAVITIYIVDLSGFTQSWRDALARWLKVSEQQLRPLPPFDCSRCMIWWTCIIYSLCTGAFSIPTLAYIALLSFLSIPLGQFFLFINESLLWLLNKMMRRYD